MLEQLLEWDRSLFLYLNQLGSEPYDFFWLLLSEKATNALLYLLLVFVYAQKKGWKAALFLLVVGGAMVGITDQLTNGFKYGVMRLRPCYTPELENLIRLVKASCGGQYSFFSGHSSNSFALACLFGLYFRRIKWVMPTLFLVASLIAYSRIYIGVHYPLDIICGALAGILIAYLIYTLMNKWTGSSLSTY